MLSMIILYCLNCLVDVAGSMDEVVQAVEKVKKEWDEVYTQTLEHVKLIEDYGKAGKGTEEGHSLQRLNGLAQDGLSLLRSMQFRLDLLAPQMPTEAEVESSHSMLKSWKDRYQRLSFLLGTSCISCF